MIEMKLYRAFASNQTGGKFSNKQKTESLKHVWWFLKQHGSFLEARPPNDLVIFHYAYQTLGFSRHPEKTSPSTCRIDKKNSFSRLGVNVPSPKKKTPETGSGFLSGSWWFQPS